MGRARPRPHPATIIANPQRRPKKILVELISDVDNGNGVEVASIAGYDEGRTLDDLFDSLKATAHFPFIRSITIYFPNRED